MAEDYDELVRGLPERPADGSAAPGDVWATIQQLPLASPLRAATTLTGILEQLRSAAAFGPGERARCLGAAAVALTALRGGVQAQIAVESHPLPAAKAELAATVLQLQGLYGDAACRAVHEMTASAGRVSLFARARVAGMLAEALASLADALVLSYQLYQAPPAGVWQRLHAAYGFAAARGLARRETVAADGRARLGERYAAALLLAMSNPYACQRSELVAVAAACQALASVARLAPAAEAATAPATGTDDAGPGYVPQERIAAGQGELALDVTPVVAAAREALDVAGDDAAEVALRRRHAATVTLPRNLLLRLIKAWQGRVERDFRRERAGHVLDTVLGLHMVHLALTGGQSFESFERQLNGQEIEISTHNAAAWIDGASRSAFAVTPARVLDQSLGGYRLLWPADHGLRVRIGELVGLAPGHDDAGDPAVEATRDVPPWLIGIVRWLRTETDGGVHVGIELVAHHARPAAVRGIDAEGNRGPVRRALVIDGPDGHDELLLPSVGTHEFAGIEVSAPRDNRDDHPALRHRQCDVRDGSDLGPAYYRVSLREPASGP